ncbi:uncharacterized protein TNCV_629621 [Trichonephila clavipes]|nr:uncharacterized protein TNCV_629621 [Trichonephila clavipes]
MYQEQFLDQSMLDHRTFQGYITKMVKCVRSTLTYMMWVNETLYAAHAWKKASEAFCLIDQSRVQKQLLIIRRLAEKNIICVNLMKEKTYPIISLSWCPLDPCSKARGCGSLVVKVTDHGRHVMNSSPVPLKTRRVNERSTLNLSRVQTSSRLCGVLGRRECLLRCRPRHLIIVQNNEVRHQMSLCS